MPGAGNNVIATTVSVKEVGVIRGPCRTAGFCAPEAVIPSLPKLLGNTVTDLPKYAHQYPFEITRGATSNLLKMKTNEEIRK